MFRSSPLLLLLVLAGCANPMGMSDGISPTAGLAQRHNMKVQTIHPGAGDRGGPVPGGTGARVARIYDNYVAGELPPIGGADATETAPAPTE